MNSPGFTSKILLILFFLSYSTVTKAQYTQELRGTVVDQLLQAPVSGATVSLTGTAFAADNIKSVITDKNGNFRFSSIPIGQYRLQISHVAFTEATIENIVVNSGKETVLLIPMAVLVATQKEVVVTANSKRNKPLNEMSAVSARAFTVEETQKYAAAVNDPLRMATGFPGVVAANDGNNDIVIRGNSPTGLLWRMEGIDIPNPNHFSSVNSSGGGISILSSHLLANSDFVTGAFASEYGNALSGVFDLRLRKGNNEKKEWALQAGLLGLNAAAEGPLKSSYNGSYLVNYRYSTLAMLNKAGFKLTQGSTNFQDLAYNIFLPTSRAGEFTLFGFGGLSSEKTDREKDSTQWKKNSERYNWNFLSNTGVSGITHRVIFGNRISLKTSIALSYVQNGYHETYIEDDYSLSQQYKDSYKTRKWIFSSTLNHIINTRNSLRAGTIINLIKFDYYRQSKTEPDAPLMEVINTRRETETVQGFLQWQYRPSEKVTFNTGLHYIQLLYNHSYSVEPRASVKFDVNSRNSIAFGYGLHSQLQGMGIYFAQTKNSSGQTVQPNRNLDLTRAHHFVTSHNYLLTKNLRLKTECYYQQLFNVPVSIADSNTFSTLNVQGDYVTQPLVNKGKGRNYGIEVSLEKYLARNLYYTVSNSFYQSRYTAADGIERNTRFNGNYVTNLIAGKDFVSENKRKTFGVNIKTIFAGGFRTTPIDLEKSVIKQYTVFKEKDAYSLRNPAYFRTDLRVSMKWNRKHLTSTLSLDIQNVTNRLNVYNESFDKEEGKIVYNYQNGLIPILNYKVEF